jgi:putative colanic acid biosynthesis UDP-glucose lipid carrier transferase
MTYKPDTLPQTINSPLRHWYCRCAKRMFDITVAAAILLTVFPVAYVIVAITVKATGGGPVLQRENRRTLNIATLYHQPRCLLRFNLTENTFVRMTHINSWPRVINILQGTYTFLAPRQTPADVYRYLTQWSPLTDVAQIYR